MSDQPPNPRRRWKRWTALALVLMIGCGVWMVSGEGETVRRAKALRLGMTKAEVAAVMGPPAESMSFSPKTRRRVVNPFQSPRVALVEGQSFATTAERWRYEIHVRIARWMGPFAVEELARHPSYPVSVSYDNAGVARRIRRWREVVGR